MHPRVMVAIAALLATVLLAGCSGDEEEPPSGSAGSPAAGDLSLPDSLGDLQSHEAECADLDTDQERCLENAEVARDGVLAAADNLSTAYDGAPATGRSYATDGFAAFVRVLAVRAGSPGLWSAESEVSARAARLGHPREWVEERDGAQCLAATTTVVPEGEELDRDDVVVLRCQQSGPELTVVVLPGGDASFDDAFAWTGEAFDAAS